MSTIHEPRTIHPPTAPSMSDTHVLRPTSPPTATISSVGSSATEYTDAGDPLTVSPMSVRFVHLRISATLTNPPTTAADPSIATRSIASDPVL